MNQVSTSASTATLERDVPVIRLKNDADLRDIYEYGRKLGQGSFGAVYEATHIETQTKWAIKEVCRPAAGSSKVEMVDNEINILKQINHAHIIHLKAVYSTITMIYLVMELCKGGDLKHLLNTKRFFTEDETRKIIISLAEAVAYLHKRDIVHRDLKLENILLKNSLDDDGSLDIRVADFGLSVKAGGVGIENIMTDACGTLIYMAPEMMSGRGYSHWCDVWSIGVIMFMLLCGEAPFDYKSRSSLFRNIMKQEVQFQQPVWLQVSDAAKYLLTCLLKTEPADRMSAHQLLENPWITGDSSVPCGPTNVLEMMWDYLEHEEKTQTLEGSSHTFFLERGGETENNGGHHAKPHPERDSNSCTLSTSTKLSHAGEKSSKQLSAKQRRSHEKKNPDVGKKPTSDSSKVNEQTLSSSSKEGLASTANQQLPQRTIPIQNEVKKRAVSQEKMCVRDNS